MPQQDKLDETVEPSESETEIEIEIETFSVLIKVHTLDKDEHRIRLVNKNEEEFHSIVASVFNSFETLQSNQALLLVDQDAVVHVFNTKNVTHIQVSRD